MHLFSHPIDSLGTFFTNHLSDPFFDGLKVESHIILLISGVAILFRKPVYLLMLVPIYFQKFFHDQPMVWSTGAQYSIEFAPILAIGVFEIIRSIKQEKYQKYALIGTAILSIACTLRISDKPFDHVEESNIQFYKKSHYSRDYNTNAVWKAIEMIPEDAAVAAQNPYLPHVAQRKNVFVFPFVKSADYILISSKEYPYPLETEELIAEIEKLKLDPKWKVVFEEDGVWLFGKR